MSALQWLKSFFSAPQSSLSRLNFVDYKDHKFYFSYRGCSRHAFYVYEHQVKELEKLILCLSPLQACLFAVILGERYYQSLRKKTPLALPHIALNQEKARYAFSQYWPKTGLVDILDTKHAKIQRYNVIDLVQNSSLLSQFSVSHSFYLGFHAGDKMAQLKRAIALYKADNSSVVELQNFTTSSPR